MNNAQLFAHLGVRYGGVSFEYRIQNQEFLKGIHLPRKYYGIHHVT